MKCFKGYCWLIAMCGCLAVTISRAATVVVTVDNYIFTPATFTINPGDTVKWVWVAGHHNTQSMSIPAGAIGWSSNIDAMTTTYSYVPTVSGLYKYTCTHHSGMDGQFFVTGCTYPPKPVVSSSTTNSACEGDSLMLYTTPQPGVRYLWLDGLVAIQRGTSDTVKVGQSGNYRVLVNRCGVDSVSDTFKAVFNQLPVPAFTFYATGLTYNFVNTTTPIGVNTYSWDFGNGSPVETTVDAVHIFSVADTYNVTLTATNKITGCADTVQSTIRAGLLVDDQSYELYEIFPNPVSNILTITTHDKCTLSLKDVKGRYHDVMVSEGKGKYTLDVSTLPIGIYTLQLINDAGVTTRKIAVLR